MSDSSARLLQLLEPAVRPGSASPLAQPTKVDRSALPFEGKSFDELLREVDGVSPAESDRSTHDPVAKAETAPADPLASLRGVENASITRLLADRAGPPPAATAAPHAD